MTTKLLVYANGVKVIKEGGTFLTPVNEPAVKEVDLTDLSGEDIDLLKVSLDDDVALNQVLAKIGQNV